MLKDMLSEINRMESACRGCLSGVGVQLRIERESMGLNKSEFASLIGVSRSWITKVESGKRINKKALEKIVRKIDKLQNNA